MPTPRRPCPFAPCRRYRQFDALQAVLKLGYRNLPELPGKGGMSASHDQRFIDKRREGLSAYLRALIADPVPRHPKP